MRGRQQPETEATSGREGKGGGETDRERQSSVWSVCTYTGILMEAMYQHTRPWGNGLGDMV